MSVSNAPRPQAPSPSASPSGGRPARRRALGATLAGAVVIGCSVGAVAAELPLKRVVLSTSGLAQFGHFGPVEGGASVDLTVRLDQVDDVLKSLTVFDAVGAVGPVSLPGREPLAELFRDLPFDQSALESPTALVGALVGSEVEIAGPVAARGRVFRVEPEQVALPNGLGTTTRHRLSLLTDKGLVQAIFEDVTALAFTDGQTRGQIDRALAGLVENRAKDRRRLAMSVLGQGKRDIGVAYVVAAPIWKTTWRLVVPKDGAKARLQGWAVLENLTGGDWKDVELTLVSGNPVTLTQPLYEAAYGRRTTVAVAGTGVQAPVADAAPPPRPVMAAPKVVGMMAPMESRVGIAREEAEGGAPAPAMAPPPPMAPVAAGTTAKAEESQTQLLHRFPRPVSLATGHTMMLPFVDREITAERVWLYQPETDARRPMAAVKLTNDGEVGLPAGIVTAFETGAEGTTDHVGDAMLPATARGADRLVSFALDTKTEIRREDRGIARMSVGKIDNGMLLESVRLRRAIVYEIKAPADDDRTVVIEEPRVSGWSLPADAKDLQETPTRLRLTVKAPKGVTTKAVMAVERTEHQSMNLSTAAVEDLAIRIGGLENLNDEARQIVDQLSRISFEISGMKNQRGALEGEVKTIHADQERLRKNLSAVGSGSDLGRSYMDTMRGQETRLAEIGKAIAAIDKGIEDKRRGASEMLRKLKL